MYYLLLPTLEDRQGLIAHLKEAGILSVFHYVPLHLSPMGRRLGGRPGECPVTEDVSDRLLRLPFYNSLSDEDHARVIEAVTRYRPAVPPATASPSKPASVAPTRSTSESVS